VDIVVVADNKLFVYYSACMTWL